MKTNPLVKTIASCALLAIAAIGLAPSASAAPPYPQPGDTGTLYVEKHRDTANVNQDGQEKNLTSPTVAGITFEVREVLDASGKGFDLSTPAGWAAAADFAENWAPGRSITLSDPVRTGTTDANGRIVFRDLPIGLYLVIETTPGDFTDFRSAESLLRVGAALPVLVTVPLANRNAATDADLFTYEIYIYPKNYSLEMGLPGDSPTDEPYRPLLPQTPGGPEEYVARLYFAPTTVSAPILQGPTAPLLALTGQAITALLLGALLVGSGAMLLKIHRRNADS